MPCLGVRTHYRVIKCSTIFFKKVYYYCRIDDLSVAYDHNQIKQ